MAVVIKVIANADGSACQYAGLYIKEFFPDAERGRGFVKCTSALNEAKSFDTPMEALEFWQTQSTYRPLRWDKKANRPLTQFTVELVPLP